MSPMEKKSFLAIRRDLISKAEGEVLEIGCGSGINFSLYRNVNVTAIDPDEILRETAYSRAKEADVPIQVMDGNAEELPFADEAFDTIVGTLVFCTIPDPARAVREMLRVCKPEGKILIFEHVLHEHQALATLQHLLTPVWKRVCGGCHLNRDTVELFVREGVDIVQLETHMHRIFVTLEGKRSLTDQR